MQSPVRRLRKFCRHTMRACVRGACVRGACVRVCVRARCVRVNGQS